MVGLVAIQGAVPRPFSPIGYLVGNQGSSVLPAWTQPVAGGDESIRERGNKPPPARVI